MILISTRAESLIYNPNSPLPFTCHHSSPDYDTATERMCMQRPPSDLQERCDLTMYGQYRKVYLCMCQGDLCNGSGRPPASAAAAALLALIIAAFLS